MNDGPYQLCRVSPGGEPRTLGTYRSLTDVRRAIIEELTRDGFFQVVTEGPEGRTVRYPWFAVEFDDA